jgi:hypothetical protein
VRTYLAGPFLAFLPRRWRSAYLSSLPVNWSRATLLSGIIEALAAIVALAVWYSVFVTRAGAANGAAFGSYAGPVGLLSMFMHPIT